MGAYEPYDPLNLPKPFADDVWIIDGPEIRMDLGPFRIPFPTRATVVRLANGELLVHSPTAPDEEMFAALSELGPVRHLLAPNSLHYWFMPDWLERFPDAVSYAVPGLAESAKREFRIDHELADGERFAWQDDIDWLLVPGTMLTEAVFFVRRAKVLILTDLIENFEPQRVRNRLQRWAILAFRANGSLPYDARITFLPKMKQVRRQIGRMLQWPTEQVVISHGKPYRQDAQAELQRAFSWVRADKA